MQGRPSVTATSRTIRAASLVAILFLQHGAAAQRLQPFFSEQSPTSPAERSVATEADGRIDRSRVRRRLAHADLSQLTQVDRASGLPVGSATSLALNLFDDADFVAQLERTDPVGNGISWTGSVIGVPEGRVILAVSDGVLAGSVSTDTSSYEIRWQPGDVYEITEVNHSPARAEAQPIHVDQGNRLTAADRSANGQDDGSVVDLLVVYTPMAKAGAGGLAAINSLISLGVSQANQAFGSVALGTTLRLVGTYEWPYTETGHGSLDLQALRTSSAVADRRDTLGADLVLMLVNDLDSCGIGYLLDALSTSFASYAYSVVERSCVSPNYSFVHELGHNMGSDHAPEDNPTSGVFSYSSGYKDYAGGFRTVMAYDCPLGCRRLLTFSSPLNAFGGRSAGRSGQDNARSLAATRSIVANFRASVGNAVVLPGAPTGLVTSSSGTSMTLQWSPGRGGTPNSYTIEAGSSSGLANLANFSTGTSGTSFAISDVAPGVYYLRVRATNSAGMSSPSNESVLTVGATCAAPQAPGGLTVSSNVNGTVVLTWNAAAGVPTTYVMEVGSSAGASNIATTDLHGTATSLTSAGVAHGTYYVRLRARNACGTSAPSNELVVIV